MSTTAPSSGSSDSPSAVDSRRAQQLMDRAFVIAERGDLPGAIVACRQSIALAPESPQGYSMLGLLLERAGEVQSAIAAYERVLQLAPDSVLERESLGRLRSTAQHHRTARRLFNFDDGELFGDERPARPAERKTKSTPGSAPVAGGTGAAPAKPAAATTADGNGVSAAAAVATDSAAIASMEAARAAARRSAKPASKTMSVPPIPPLQNGRLPRVPPAIEEYREETLFEKLLRRPTFFFRGAPLMATTIASLLILLLAHQFSVSRTQAETLPPAPAPATGPAAGVAPAANTPPVVNSATPASANNATDTPASDDEADATPAEPASPAPAAAPPATPAPATPATPAATPRPAPAAPRATPRPARPTPAPTRRPAPPANNNDDGGNFPAMPPPRLGPEPAPDDRIRIRPPATTPTDDRGVSRGGAPYDPAGSGDGYIRVQPTGAIFRAPSRPENRAASAERAGSRSNNSVTAIALLSRSIANGGNDTPFRYQQRAQIYLQSGDRARAVADFQSAITGYREMIARGERVSFARSGIRASQRGIQLAVGRA